MKKLLPVTPSVRTPKLVAMNPTRSRGNGSALAWSSRGAAIAADAWEEI
ncbi:MAG: hypothetical protein P4L83_10995 [Nevskia sp.]|nr:hypothetical protein [Nevskia sp.]